MKIRKIFIIILVLSLFFFIGTPKTYAAAPAANASKAEIEKYIKKNSDLSKVSISKLIGWYNTVGQDTLYIQKVDSALKAKSKKNIQNYLKGKSTEQIQKVPTSVLNSWNSIVSDTYKEKIKKAQEAIAKEQQNIDPTENYDFYDLKLSKSKLTSSQIGGIVGPILGYIRNIGIVVSVIALMIIGVKFMLGSAEEKANYKETLIPYLIGIIILLAGSIIPSVIYNIFE